MTNLEIAEVLKTVNLYELAVKTADPRLPMTDNERETAIQLDQWAREIGRTGYDRDHEIAQFMTQTIQEEVYDAPDELLDTMFTRGFIGEFDDYEAGVQPVKNTLQAYESAPGGNVPKTYLDYTCLKPDWKHLQVETQLSFADLRHGGWKSVALLTDYATRALKNKMFYFLFQMLDAGIAAGAENYIVEATSLPTQKSMDQLALYVMDRAEGGPGVIVALSKYIQAASKLPGFVSEEMKNEIHRTGRLGTYDGVSMIPISSARKQANGELLIPSGRMYGIGGPIGSLDLRGEIRVLETEENQKEVVNLKITGFSFGWAFHPDTLEKAAKMVLS